MLAAESAIFIDNLGAEAITYLPAAGGSRAIDALINREQPAETGDAPQGHAPLLTIVVINSATTGISSDEVDCGGDKVNLPVRLGETAQQRRITGIISQDSGMVKLEVR